MPTATHHHGAFNGIFQLAYIARPMIVLQHFNGVRAETEIGWSPDIFVLIQEVLGEDEDVISPFPERWDVNVHHVEAVIQVFSEGAILHLFKEILIGGGNDPYVYLQGAGRANSIERAFLDDPQQFYLHGRAHFRNLVQEEGAAVGNFQDPGLARNGPGERAFLMPEQFRFQQSVGKGGAIDHHKFSLASRSNFMDESRYKFFARAALSRYQGSGFGISDLDGV